MTNAELAERLKDDADFIERSFDAKTTASNLRLAAERLELLQARVTDLEEQILTALGERR